MDKKLTMLMILDGFGKNPNKEGNAIELANTPNIDELMKKYSNTQIFTSGLAVGLPEGQMGNSEVGHTNIGAGRIVYQELTRITKSIEDGDFFSNQELVAAIENCQKNNSKLHIMGLLSDGGVHSHMRHLFAVLELAKRKGFEDVYVHCFLDGRDTPPASAEGYILKLEENLSKEEVNKLLELGMEDFQEVSDIKDNKINLTVDNKKIIIELNEDKKMYIVYNKTNNHVYYSLDENNDLYYYKDDSLKKAHDKNNDIIKPDENASGKSKTLLEGSWTVGSNIEEGIYNLHALSGNGNLYIKNSKGRLKVNILLGVGNEYNTKNNIYLKDYNNVTLEKDDVITIGKDMKVKFNAIK